MTVVTDGLLGVAELIDFLYIRKVKISIENAPISRLVDPAVLFGEVEAHEQRVFGVKLLVYLIDSYFQGFSFRFVPGLISPDS